MKHWRYKLLLMVVVLAACAPLRPATEPIGHRFYPAAEENGQKSLLILLPGIGGKIGDFERYGFVSAVQRAQPTRDIMVVDAHFAYYRKQTIIARLHEDIVQPAKAKGYCQIDVAGISLGGYGALLYLKHYPNEIHKVYLLAPYLGEPRDYAYLQNGAEPPLEVMHSGNLWPWLMALSEAEKSRIALAFGTQDKFAKSLSLLQNLLPAKGSFTIAGKHRWPVWQSLWQQGLTQHQWLYASTCQPFK